MDFGASERPLWRKADVSEYPQDFNKIDQLGTSALPSEADIQLILAERSANDPKQPSAVSQIEVRHATLLFTSN